MKEILFRGKSLLSGELTFDSVKTLERHIKEVRIKVYTFPFIVLLALSTVIYVGVKICIAFGYNPHSLIFPCLLPLFFFLCLEGIFILSLLRLQKKLNQGSSKKTEKGVDINKFL